MEVYGIQIGDMGYEFEAKESRTEFIAALSRVYQTVKIDTDYNGEPNRYKDRTMNFRMYSRKLPEVVEVKDGLS